MPISPCGIKPQVGGFFASQAQLCGGAGQGPTGQAVHAEQKTVERLALPLDRWHGEHVHADRKPQPFGHRINPNRPLRSPVWWFGGLAHFAGLSHPETMSSNLTEGAKIYRSRSSFVMRLFPTCPTWTWYDRINRPLKLSVKKPVRNVHFIM